jgi:hypothetical protein
MILFIVAQFAMTVAAENDGRIIKVAAGDMMGFQSSPIGLATLRALRIVCAETF